MTRPLRDTIHVPLSTNTPPYRIDEAADGDWRVRIRRRDPGLLVLVPPGDGAKEFRSRLIAELQAYSVCSSATGRYDRLLAVLLFGLVAAMLLGLAAFMIVGQSGFLDGTVLEDSAPAATPALLIGYAPMLMPAMHLAHPAEAPRDMPSSACRHLTVDEFSGGPSVQALRRALLDSPAALRPGSDPNSGSSRHGTSSTPRPCPPSASSPSCALSRPPGLALGSSRSRCRWRSTSSKAPRGRPRPLLPGEHTNQEEAA